MLSRPPIVAVCDGEPRFRQATSRRLKTHGYRTELLANGRELIGAASRRQFDCWLLDLHMAEATGFDVPVQLSEQAQGPGAVGYLLKPVDLTALLEAMTLAMEAGRAPPEASLLAQKPIPPEST